jgi:hypothetical protein
MHVRAKLVIIPELSLQQFLFSTMHHLKGTGWDGWIDAYLSIVYGCGGYIQPLPHTPSWRSA